MGYLGFLSALRARVRLRSLLLRQCLAEALGVFILIVITLSGAAQSTTSAGAKGGYFSSAFSGGIAVMVAIHISGGVSDAIHHYSNGTLAVTGPRETASIFATYPAPYLSLWNGFFDQVLGTAVLVVSILALIDPRNRRIPPGLEPLGVALLVVSLGLALGANCSCAINPARDLGPRLFTFLAGWGPQVFSAGQGWWWVPVVAPMLGSALGTATYQFGVAFHHPLSPEEEEEEEEEVRQAKGSPPEKELEMPIFVVNTFAEKSLDAANGTSEEGKRVGRRAPSTQK
nr:aquaporin-10 isoform X1 [Anolis sagrei ordinatus]